MADGLQPGFRWLPPEDSVWACPCGFSGTYRRVMSHRKGWKNRPACARGRMYQVQPGTPAPAQPEPEQSYDGPVIEPAADDVRASPEDMPEDAGQPTGGDRAEDIARQMLFSLDPASIIDPAQHAHAPQQPPGPSLVTDLDGLPQADWTVEGAPPGTPVSEARETVTLPTIVRVMYDWFVGQGFNGTFNEWCFDMISDHWTTCMGKLIVVLDRSEVEEVDNAGSNGSGHKGARVGAIPAA